VDLGTPQTFDRAMIDECVTYGVRVKSFELQCRQGNGWKTFFRGQAMGRYREVKFAPVTARHVRLSIDGEGGPTINEFQLFPPAKRKPSPQ
jgi:alpha-L-fucosidase